ncbi:MAG: hypothetical protein ISR65_00280 [Bacteriovoracaceae bacterium]|nr:hypothetical protein [Bacteriovoracaceae bacterium]
MTLYGAKNMGEEEDLNKKIFIKALSEDEKREFIDILTKNLMRYRIYFAIWKKGRPVIQFKAIERDLYTVTKIIIRPIKDTDRNYLTQESSTLQQVLLKTTVAGEQYFSTVNLCCNVVDRIHYVLLSNLVYKGVQRANARLSADKNNKIAIKFGANVFQCLDISSSGTCFVADEELSKLFTVEKEFKKIQLVFNKEKYDINKLMIACNIDLKEQNSEGKKLFKIGIQFVNVEVKSKAALIRQVNKALQSQSQTSEEFDFSKVDIPDF